MNITLIQTGSDRKAEIKRFVDSLNAQQNISFNRIQYIYIDQSDNKELFIHLDSQIDFLYLKSNSCSLSYARNLALPFVKGNYVAFPDDDCWYPNNLLEQVFCRLDNIMVDGITGRVVNEDYIEYNRYPDRSGVLSLGNLCGASSICLFVKYNNELFFDENIGVGTVYNLGSGEESDYLLTLIRNKYRILYDRDIYVYHPINIIRRDEQYLIKCYLYARGLGYVIRKHKLGWYEYGTIILRPFIGMFYFISKGDLYMFKRSFLILKGRLEGLMFNIKNNKK